MPPRWHPPSEKQQLDAIGIRGSSLVLGEKYVRGPRFAEAFKACKCCFEPNPASFENIEPPGPGDWLNEHIESTPDQTFLDYVSAMPNRPERKRKIVALLPLCEPEELATSLGDGPAGQAGTFPSMLVLQSAVQAFFQMPVRRMRPMSLGSLHYKAYPGAPEGPVTVREDRGFGPQWHAGEVLSAIRKHVPATAFCVLAITMKDLYPKPEWNFVYGLGDLKNRVGVFSFVRHDPCFGRHRGPLEEGQLLHRSVKTTLHEIGHMFGLKHCTWFNCLMRGNNGDGVEHQDAPLHLCPVCLRKLHWNIGFDIVKRYVDLLRVYEPYEGSADGFANEVGFLRQRLQMLDGLPPTQLEDAWIDVAS